MIIADIICALRGHEPLRTPAQEVKGPHITGYLSGMSVFAWTAPDGTHRELCARCGRIAKVNQ